MSEQQLAPEQRGVAFPLVDGARSTTGTARSVFAEAARAVDAQLADAIEAERDWRRNYLDHLRRLVEAEIRSPERAPGVPQAGLEALHRRFAFTRDGGEDAPLAEALTDPGAAPPASVRVDGGGSPGPSELTVPVGGEELSGDALHRQLDDWVERGIAEPSFAEAVREVMANPDWLDLSDLTVAVLGAGAEMGPLTPLCGWRANLLAVDVPNPQLWQGILRTVRQGNARAHVPVSRPLAADDPGLADAAGIDLVADLPDAAAWLEQFEGPLTLGNYVYADGATNVRVAMAVDALTAHLAARRDDVSTAVLVTPTDVYGVPAEVVDSSWSRYTTQTGGLSRAVRSATRGRLLAPNHPAELTTPDGARFGVADCLVPQQGPNYALAKRLQRWRARLARDQGLLSSVNVAPATRTRSVVKNRVLAAAFTGASRFGVEVFEPATSNTLMAAMLVHDLRSPRSVANPTVPLAHPLELFMRGANHGGMWRIPHAPRSVLGLAAALGLARGGR